MRNLNGRIMHYGLEIFINNLINNKIHPLLVECEDVYAPENWETLPTISARDAADTIGGYDMCMLYCRDDNYNPSVGRWINVITCNGWGSDLIANYNLAHRKNILITREGGDTMSRIISEFDYDDSVIEHLLNRIEELEEQTA